MLIEQLRLYASACDVKAINAERDRQRLEEQLRSIDERYLLPGSVKGIASFAESEKTAEAARLKQQMERCSRAAAIYQRRAQYAALPEPRLYFGESEMNPATWSVEEVDNGLLGECVAAGIVQYADNDMQSFS
jgi:hypothetical protein